MFVSFSSLIKHITVENFNGNIDANDENTTDLVRLFSKYVQLLEDHIFLTEEFAQLVATETYDVAHLTMMDKLRKFIVIYDENYIPLIRTFANNEIYTEEEGRKKGESYRDEWDRLRTQLESTPKQHYEPRNFIKTSYASLTAIYCGLLKNVIYASTFDFVNYVGIVREPIQIMELVNRFLAARDAMTVITLADFRQALKQIFGSNWISAEPVLLFTPLNSGTFPLFVFLEGRVFISHTTTFLIFLLLHPILLKENYDKETARITKQLETGKAKQAFENAGFCYVPNVTDRPKNPHLEIDGLAGRNGILFVVEVKGRGLTKFYEHKNKHEELKRDLAGIVDGLKFSTRKGRLLSKKIPSLTEKIAYARENMQKHGFSPSEFATVKGVIVIKDFPPIENTKA
jgi:hypothetical protein